MASNSGDSSASCAQVLSSQPPMQNSIEIFLPAVLVITSRHEPHRKRHSSVAVFMSVAERTCLLSRYPGTGCVILFIKNLVPQQQALLRDHYPATGLHTTILLLVISQQVMNRDSSVNTETSNRLDDEGSIPSRDRIFLFTT
jgi:hypothetical protein